MDVKQAAVQLRDKIASRGITRLAPPDLIALQVDSYKWFLETGIREVLESFSPIEDLNGNLQIHFLDHHLEDPKHSVEECKSRDLMYEAPLKVKVRFVNKVVDEEKESEIYLGDIPLMTPKGTFVVNGAERVVVSQLIRSSGCYFKQELDISGEEIYSGQIIPREGSWLDITSDARKVISARIAQTKKVPITILLRAFDALPGADPVAHAIELVDPVVEQLVGRVCAKTVSDKVTGEVIVEEGEVIDAELARKLEAALGSGMEVGEPEKLGAHDSALVGRKAAETIVAKDTGEVIVEAGEVITDELAEQIKAALTKSKKVLVVGQMERPKTEVEALTANLAGHTAAETIVDKATGEVLVEKGQVIDVQLASKLEEKLGARTEYGEMEKFGAHDPALMGRKSAETLVAKDSGEALVEAGQEITEELLEKLKATFGKSKKIAVFGAATEIAARTIHIYSRVEHKRGRPVKIKVYKERVRTSTTGDLLAFFGSKRKVYGNQIEDLVGQRPTEPVLSESGKVIVEAYEKMTEPQAKRVASLGLKELEVVDVDEYIDATLEADPCRNADEALMEIHKRVRPGDPPSRDEGRNILRNFFIDQKRYDLGRVGRFKINEKLRHFEDPRLGLDGPIDFDVRTVTKQDLLAVVSYMIGMSRGEGQADDIDHLANKRVRAVGELLQDQFRLGMLRIERVARERMNTMEPDKITPQAVISVKPLDAAIQSFLSSGQLSQYMDQVNPLAELNHRRRLSALGPGGLSRQSAKLEVRDVHSSHYGRLCPVETPEGPNIGLIGSLALYAKLDEFGFILTPYVRVEKGRVTDDVVYLSAGVEEEAKIAPADAPVDEEGYLTDKLVTVRFGEKFPKVNREEVEYMDVSPAQVFSIGAGLIPFLENDDPIRGLMGSNMQKQAVPLVKTARPYIHTGVEGRAARDARSVVVAQENGVVTEVDADRIVVTDVKGKRHLYRLENFLRTNQATCVNERRLVQKGQRVRAGDALADGPAISEGELALGRNLLVAFIPWEGYNYEDAIVLSERMVRDDELTSVHIEKYEIEARDTKLGPEEMTREIPNVGEDARRNLDERGIIRPGAEVGPQDILVGKVAPKGQTELTAEEKLVIAIFGKKAEEMRDVSLRMPHGEYGKVISVTVFSRYKYHCRRCKEQFAFSKEAEGQMCPNCGGDLEEEIRDELPPGVNQLVRVFVAQERHVMVGDKMAGRHGNKGVISTIVPIEDMPYLGNGKQVDIVLNPLGVPTRMNVGQVLETHLGLVAHEFGLRFETPIFSGATEAEIKEAMALASRKMVGEFLREHLQEFGIIMPVEIEDYEEMKALLPKLLADKTSEELETLATRLAVSVEITESGDKKALIEGLCDKAFANAENRCGFDPETGRFKVYDGRTGRPLDQPVVCGNIYMMKLHHLVDDKIHARSTGPYSLVTQQPLGGKAQFGGQRFGEMEVWALEAYGAAHTLQELLTIKSDDVEGRTRTYEAIVKGENIQEPGVPESFKILVKELQALGLEVAVESAEGTDIELKELDDETADYRFMH